MIKGQSTHMLTVIQLLIDPKAITVVGGDYGNYSFFNILFYCLVSGLLSLQGLY